MKLQRAHNMKDNFKQLGEMNLIYDKILDLNLDQHD